MCIGCGLCCSVGDKYSLKYTQEGFLQAHSIKSNPDAVDLASKCPMSGDGMNETEFAAALFPDAVGVDDEVGRYEAIFAGHISDGKKRIGTGSGGGVSWLLAELLDAGHIDAVAHVKHADGNSLFSYGISRTTEEIYDNRKSFYNPIEFQSILEAIKSSNGSFAITAIPCMAKAIRMQMEQDKDLKNIIKYVIGIVCGHLKSRAYSEYLAWNSGVKSDKVKWFDFRDKLPSGGADEYGFSVRDHEVTYKSSRMADYFGTSWEVGFFRYPACDYCNDIFAETADIVFGDAWIEPCSKDWMGGNVIAVRSRELMKIINSGIIQGELDWDIITLEQLNLSQAGGIRHRREGLAYRLLQDTNSGKWVPKKRIKPESDHISEYRKNTRPEN